MLVLENAWRHDTPQYVALRDEKARLWAQRSELILAPARAERAAREAACAHKFERDGEPDAAFYVEGRWSQYWYCPLCGRSETRPAEPPV